MTAPVARKALIGALPLIAQTLGDKYGVKVHIGRTNQAYTDGSNIHLPSLPLESDSIEIVANGYIDHEASHIKETDFKVFGIRKPAIEQHMLNILEDLRIEKRMMERYPGTRKNLNKLVHHLVKEGDVFKMPTGDPADDHPANVLVNAALQMGRCEVLEQEALNEIAAAYEQRIATVFTKGTVVKLSALLAKATEQDNTAGCLKLAKKILKMVEDELKNSSEDENNSDQTNQQDDQGDQGDDDSSQSGQDDDQSGDQNTDQSDDGSSGSGDSENSDGSDDSEGDGGQSGQGSSDEDGDSDDSGNGGESDDSNEADDGQSGQNSSSGDSQDGTDDSGSSPSKGAGSGDGEKMMQQIKNASDSDINAKSDLGDMIADRLSKDLDDHFDSEEGHSDHVSDIGSYKTYQSKGIEAVTKSQVKQATVKLRARLQAKIEASLRENSYLSESGRKVCSRALPGVKTGNAKVFKHRNESRGLDTAIQILVDRSGSMGWSNHGTVEPAIGPAMQSAMAVMASLEGIKGVSTACSVFPECESLTGFEESLARTTKRYELAVCGGTPLTEGLLWCVKHQLSKRREQRKIFIVITDGDPDNPATATKTVRKMAAAGIEMIGIGIGPDAHYVKTLFPVSDTIKSVNALPQTLFRLIQAKF